MELFCSCVPSNLTISFCPQKNCTKRLTYAVTYKHNTSKRVRNKKIYKTKLNLFAYVHRHKQAKYLTYRSISTLKSNRWLRLHFFDYFRKSRRYFAHRTSEIMLWLYETISCEGLDCKKSRKFLFAFPCRWKYEKLRNCIFC